MKKYTIYFELFGKKMKHSLMATDKTHAIKLLHERLTIHSVCDEEKEFDEAAKKIFNFFKY